MTLDSLFVEVDEFQDAFFPNYKDAELVYYTNALAGEVGELCNLAKKRAGGGCSNPTIEIREELLDELSDIMIYSLLLYRYFDISPLEATNRIRVKMESNALRLKEKRNQGIAYRNWRVNLQKKVQKQNAMKAKKKSNIKVEHIVWETAKQKRRKQKIQKEKEAKKWETDGKAVIKVALQPGQQKKQGMISKMKQSKHSHG